MVRTPSYRDRLADGLTIRFRDVALPDFPLDCFRSDPGAAPTPNSARRLAAHPGLVTWRPREITRESFGTFSVTVVPAAITDPSPTVTGATNCVSLPMKTPSWTIVSAFRIPS